MSIQQILNRTISACSLYSHEILFTLLLACTLILLKVCYILMNERAQYMEDTQKLKEFKIQISLQQCLQDCSTHMNDLQNVTAQLQNITKVPRSFYELETEHQQLEGMYHKLKAKHDPLVRKYARLLVQRGQAWEETRPKFSSSQELVGTPWCQ